MSSYSLIILPAGSTLFEKGKLPENCSVAAFSPKLICSAGVWGCWSELSSCSVSCGEGVYSRTRQCQSLPPGKPFTIPCDGPAEETVSCNTGPCISKMLPYLFGYKTGLSLSRMTTNNQISPMQFCCNTGFILPKQSQRSRFFGIVLEGKNTVL